MNRFVPLLALVVLAGCTNETLPTSPHLKGPVFTVTSNSAGGVSFAAGSGCSQVQSHYECTFTVQNVGTVRYQLQISGNFRYSFDCVHKKTGKSSSKYPETPNVTTVQNFSIVTPVSGEITVTDFVIAPTAPTDCSTNHGAFTVTRLVSQFVPAGWGIIARSDIDPDGHFASLIDIP